MNLSIPAAILLFGCAHVTGSGHLKTEERTVKPFTALSVGGGFEVRVHRGSPQKVVVKADDNLLDRIETKVEDGRLEVELKRNTNVSLATLEVDVTVPELTAIETSGGVKLEGDGPKGKSCKLEHSGGTEVHLKDVACDALQLEASGGANVSLSGAARRFELDASGGVDLATAALKVSDAKLSASGGVSGEVAVSETLDADFSGGVNIKIKGHPRMNRLNTSGGADATFGD